MFEENLTRVGLTRTSRKRDHHDQVIRNPVDHYLESSLFLPTPDLPQGLGGILHPDSVSTAAPGLPLKRLNRKSHTEGDNLSPEQSPEEALASLDLELLLQPPRLLLGFVSLLCK